MGKRGPIAVRTPEPPAFGVDFVAVAGRVAEGAGLGLSLLSAGGAGQERHARNGEAGGGD